MSLEELKAMQRSVNREIEIYVEGIKDSDLAKAMGYSLLSEGKRLRPILCLLMAKALGKGFDVMPSALAIELFHTASLIADDLPCMDNDDYRRGRPSLHKRFSEAEALLASYALMTEGFGLIAKSGEHFTKQSGLISNGAERVKIALKETSLISGPRGTVLGQYFDIEQLNASTEKEVKELHYLKTGTVFQGAFVLGYIFGGGDLNKLSLVEKLSRHLGVAFQIRDDFEDVEEGGPNFVSLFGEKKAMDVCRKEIEGFDQTLDMLSLDKKDFAFIIEFLFPAALFGFSAHGV